MALTQYQTDTKNKEKPKKAIVCVFIGNNGIIYEAYKIDFKPLKDEIFSIPKKAKIKKMK